MEAVDHFEANSQRDGLVASHGQIKAIAMTLFNVSNNISGLAPALDAAFTKSFFRIANPVIDYARQSKPGYVRKYDATHCTRHGERHNDDAVRAAGGNFQLNIICLSCHAMLGKHPLAIHGVSAFIEFCMTGSKPIRWHAKRVLSKVVDGHEPQSLHRYEKAAKLTKEAFASGKTIRELCIEQTSCQRKL